jgi:hypothetical protein
VDDDPVCEMGKTASGELLVERYIAAVYWAMATLTTVGYGDVHAVSYSEIIFATMVSSERAG